MDKKANLYGQTFSGGAYDLGTVFKLTPDGTETVLHSFGADHDSVPGTGLVADEQGNIYGGTGGGLGTIFKLAPDGTYSTLYRFPDGGGDGTEASPLIVDKKGNLYGETLFGGNPACTNGCGTIFKLTPRGGFIALYRFTGGGDGRYPTGGLTPDSEGNFYGATGGSEDIGDRGHGNWGTIFKLAPNGALTVLHTFVHRKEGALVLWGVTRDDTGNLYGAAMEGGHKGCYGYPYGCGNVFRLATDGTLTVLHAFRGGDDGARPNSRPVLDEHKNLYGTTWQAPGSIYRISASGKKTNLYVGGSEGVPWALLYAGHGTFYGTSKPQYGSAMGVVFRLQH